MKTYIPLKENPEYTDLQVNVFYDKGGSNYFSGQIIRRGIYVSVTPVLRNGSYITQKLFTGLKQLVEEMGRASEKKLTQWKQLIQSQIDRRFGLTWGLVLKVLEQEKLELDEKELVNG